MLLFCDVSYHQDVRTIRKSGLELLGSPIWGPPQFYDAFLSVQFDKIVAIQDKLVDLEDPQVELHLLRSCLSVCKVTYLLRCVPSSSLGSFPSHFDLSLYRNALVESCVVEFLILVGHKPPCHLG